MSEKQTKRILLIEDDAVIIRSLKPSLEEEDFVVSVAGDGESGLAQALDSHPDLILLDIFLPKMGGLEMLKQLREDVWGKTAEVMILTNAKDNETLKDAIDYNCYDFLVKSDWNLSQIVDQIKRKIQQKDHF